MKIYKNPYVSYDCYYIKTGKAPSYGKFESSASKGYYVHNRNGKWEIEKVRVYDGAVKKEFSLVAENRVSIDKVIEKTILETVLGLVDSNSKIVDEPKQGTWEKRVWIIFDSEKVGYNCSECNTTWDSPTKYCPNCGAKMLEE